MRSKFNMENVKVIVEDGVGGENGGGAQDGGGKFIEVGGNISKYGTIFKINYQDEFQKFNGNCGDNYSLMIEEKQMLLNKKDLDVYHLECLEILSLENWNKCFRVNKGREIIEINYPYFGDICCDLQKAMKGTLNFTGKSFTNEALIPGDIETYYFQYMAQQMFGSHLAFYGFQNLSDIKKQFSTIPKQLIQLFQDRTILKEFYKIFDIKKNLDKNLDKNLELLKKRSQLFEKGDVLEVSIFLKKPILEMSCTNDNLANKFTKLENKYYINNSLWKIYFILL